MTKKTKSSTHRKESASSSKSALHLAASVPAPSAGTARRPRAGIVGWNSPRFMESHGELLRIFKEKVAARGLEPVFLGISGGSDVISTCGSDSAKSESSSSHPAHNGHGTAASLAHYWLPSRDIVADQIELLTHEEQLSVLVMVPWSVHSLVGMQMAAARCGVPTLFLPCYCAWPTIGKDDSHSAEKKAMIAGIPYSHCAMLFLSEVLGLSRMGTMDRFLKDLKEKDKKSSKPAAENVSGLNEDTAEMLDWAAQRCADIELHKVTPRRFFSQAAFHNAICVDLALGGSAESVLHLTALARESGVPLPLSGFNEQAKQVHSLAHMDRNGEFTIGDFMQWGGLSGLVGVLRTSLQAAPTISGKNIFELSKDFAGLKSQFRLNHTYKKHESLAVFSGNLAPEGAVLRASGLADRWLNYSAPATVFDSESECVNAVMSKKVKKGDLLVVRYCGPKGSPGMPYLCALRNALMQKGLEEQVAVITDGRMLISGRTAVFEHVSPEAAAGSTFSILQTGDWVSWNLEQKNITARLTDTEIKVRLSRWRERTLEIRNSFLSRYSKYSSSSSLGATLS